MEAQDWGVAVGSLWTPCRWVGAKVAVSVKGVTLVVCPLRQADMNKRLWCTSSTREL